MFKHRFIYKKKKKKLQMLKYEHALRQQNIYNIYALKKKNYTIIKQCKYWFYGKTGMWLAPLFPTLSNLLIGMLSIHRWEYS